MKKSLLLIAAFGFLFLGCKPVVNNYYTTYSSNGGSSGNSNATSMYPGVEDNVARPGKIYYSDGTVSEFYNKDKTPVGIVANLTDDGNVKYIIGLKKYGQISTSSARSYAKSYDAECNFNKEKWEIPDINMFDFISASADLINNGVTNLLVAGYTKSLGKVHNMNYWAFGSANPGDGYAAACNPITLSSGKNFTSACLILILDVSAL